MTPGAIVAMLEVHCHPPSHRPHLTEYFVAELHKAGLIDKQDLFCGLTPMGRAHVEQLCGLGLPVAAWMTADGSGMIRWDGQRAEVPA
jgi:hypothetical protein